MMGLVSLQKQEETTGLLSLSLPLVKTQQGDGYLKARKWASPSTKSPSTLIWDFQVPEL